MAASSSSFRNSVLTRLAASDRSGPCGSIIAYRTERDTTGSGGPHTSTGLPLWITMPTASLRDWGRIKLRCPDMVKDPFGRNCPVGADLRT